MTSVARISNHSLDSNDHNEVYSMVESLQVRWAELGMKLGVSYDEIEAIDDEKSNNSRKVMKILSVWLRRGRKNQPIPTWKILHDAVETLDRNIADAIVRDHSCSCHGCLDIRPDCITDLPHVQLQQQQQHNNIVSTNPLSLNGGNLATPLTTSPSEKSSVASTHLPDGLIDSVIELSGEYDSMLTHIQDKIEKKVDDKKLNLRQIARFFSRSLNRTYCQPDKNDTLEDILQPITQSMNYIDPNMDLLLKVDKEYCDRAHQRRLHEYSQKLTQFRKSTLITNFIAAIKNKRSQMKKSSKKKHSADAKIIVRVSDIYSDAMVDNVLKLKEKIFRNLDVGLVEVHHSVLTLVYHIPHDLVTQAITIVEQQKSLLKELGVISVQIADTVIEISAADDVSLSDEDTHDQHDNDDMNQFLKDLPPLAEGMLSIKPHWDEIGEEEQHGAHTYSLDLSIATDQVSRFDHEDTGVAIQHTDEVRSVSSDDISYSPPLNILQRANSQASSSAGSHYSRSGSTYSTGDQIKPMETAHDQLETDKPSKEELVTTSSSLHYGRPLGRSSTAVEDDATVKLVDIESAIVDKIQENVEHPVYPALIILGGLPDSGKREFLGHLQYKSPDHVDETSVSQNLVISSGFQLPSFQQRSVAIKDTKLFQFYCLLSGFFSIFKSTNPEIVNAADTSIKHWPIEMQNAMKNFREWKDDYQKRIHSIGEENYEEKEEQCMWKAFSTMERSIHRGIAMTRLWQLTINRTSLRFLECFRGHLYNSHIWLFMDLDRDLKDLHMPPDTSTTKFHPHAMAWRSRLHYLLRSSCLADVLPCYETKRAKVCRIFAIHKEDISNEELQKNLRDFREEAEIAAAQYGFTDLFDFEIVPVRKGESSSTKIYESYVCTLPKQKLPFSWTFLRIVLELRKSVFVRYSEILELAKHLVRHRNVEEFVKEFLQYYTSIGDILNVRQVAPNSEWVILQPDTFLQVLCEKILRIEENEMSVQYGIITQAKASELFGVENGKKYFDVLVSLGLAAKIETNQLSSALRRSCQFSNETTDFVYFISIIRKKKPDTDNEPQAIQMICGLKSAEMNMQVSFTRELLVLCPDVLLGCSSKVNVTQLKTEEMEINFIVQGDIIEIRLTKHGENIYERCKKILKAVQKIASLRAERGGQFEYHLRTLRSSEDVQSSESIRGNLDYYHFNNQKSNHNASILNGVPLFFEGALQSLEEEGHIKHYKLPENAIITADDIYSLAKEVKSTRDAEALVEALHGPSGVIKTLHDVPSRMTTMAISDVDPLWFTAFESILQWRQKMESTHSHSKHNLALVLIKAEDFESNRALKRLTSKLDIQMYSKAMKFISENKKSADDQNTVLKPMPDHMMPAYLEMSHQDKKN